MILIKVECRQVPNMAKVISQETFNTAVKENVDDLGMDPEEAVQEAIVQFEKQVSFS